MEQNIKLVSQTTEHSPPPQQSKEDWEVEFERLEHHILRALKHQDMYNLTDIKEKIRAGEMFIWPNKDSVIITEFAEYPRYRVLSINLVAGNYKEVIEMLPSLEEFAKQCDCKKIIGGGRKGWIRKLKPHGFKEMNLLVKEL
jgi:hypothetical protein